MKIRLTRILFTSLLLSIVVPFVLFSSEEARIDSSSLKSAAVAVAAVSSSVSSLADDDCDDMELRKIRKKLSSALIEDAGKIKNPRAILGLIRLRANVNARSNNGDSPLIRASSGGNLGVVKVLLEHNAEVNLQNKWGDSSLIRASTGGNLEVVKVLLEHKAEVNVQNNYGSTSLMLTDDPKISSILLNNGAEINTKDYSNMTALILSECLELTRLLIECKADPNAQDSGGNSAVMWNVINMNPTIVGLLCESGADFNAPDSENMTPFNVAQYMNGWRQKKEFDAFIKFLKHKLEYRFNWKNDKNKLDKSWKNDLIDELKDGEESISKLRTA